jgi:hypothetical protein
MKMIHISAQLSDKELLAQVKRLAEHERVATADLIATLAELDARRLYLGEGREEAPVFGTQLGPARTELNAGTTQVSLVGCRC